MLALLWTIVLVSVAVLIAGVVSIFANWVPKPSWAKRHPLLLLGTLLFLIVVGGAAAWLSERPLEPELAFTSPRDGASVGETFEVSGVASGLDDDQELWLFVVGGNGRTPGLVYYRYQKTPLQISEGQWNARITSLGESRDPYGSEYKLALIRADAGCSRAIATLSPTAEGEIYFQKPLPQGCEEVADGLTVRKGT